MTVARALCLTLVTLAALFMTACRKSEDPKPSPSSGQPSTGAAAKPQESTPAQAKPASTGGSVGSAYKKGLDKLEGGMQKKVDQTEKAQR